MNIRFWWKNNLVLMVLCCTVLACANKDEPRKSIPLVKFDVNPQLLGDSIVSNLLAVKFSIPKHWKRLPPAIEEQVRVRLAEVNVGDIRPEPLYIFVEGKSNATLTVSSLTFAALGSSVAQQREVYVRRITTQIDTTKLQVSEFRKDNMHLTQCVIRSSEKILFRVLVEAKKQLLQFDYAIPLTVYTQEIKAVESSIGSIFTIQ
jgi:hypothetical protein